MRWQWTGFGTALGAVSMGQLPALFLARDVIHDQIEQRLLKVAGRSLHSESRLTFFQSKTVWVFGLRTYWRQTASAERELLAALNDLAQGRFPEARLERLRQSAQHGWLMFAENAEAALWWLCELPAIFTETPQLPTETLLTTPAEDVREMIVRLLDTPDRIVFLHQPLWVWLPGAGLLALASLALVWGSIVGLGVVVRLLALLLGAG